VKHPCSLLDVYPTLTDACAIDDPGLVQSPDLRMSLAPQCLPATSDAGDTAYLPITRPVLGEVESGPVRLRSLRKGRWLFLRSETLLDAREALYDVVGDPLEKRNRLDAQDLAADTLRRELLQLFPLLAQRALTGRSRQIDPVTKSDIHRLGYTGGDEPDDERAPRAADPPRDDAREGTERR
jgi:arylsulfatase A-like enzyme